MAVENLNQLFSIGGKQNSVVGPDLASVAGVLSGITHMYHRVTGALAITGITIPHEGFEGTIGLIPTGAFTWTNATNIAVAGTAVVSRVVFMTYSQKTGKWYPSYV